MVANAIALKKEFKVGEEALAAEFERLGAKAGRSALAIRAHYEAKKRMGDLEQELISKQVEDYLLAQIKVETVPASANADSGESNSGEPNA
jgi:FKBP-type peptidyl-prolyl cis-trans isomerase (trigger factor)